MAERFGDFELLSLLSADAALESYLAAPPGGGATVVLRRMKRSLAGQPGARDTFLQDAQAALQLSHGSVARVVALGEVAHQPYVAHERIQGDSLDTLIRRAKLGEQWPLPLPRALALFLPALEGLAAAHAQKPALLHREVSPRNVYVTAAGASVLTSFGLARTRRSAGLGISDAFLSPEQMHGRPLDAASDVFTAGLMLFELCCGRLPASGEVGELVGRIGTGELDAASDARAEAAPLDALLRRALAPRREARFAGAGELLAAVRALGLEVEPQPALAQWLAGLPPGPPPEPVKVEAIEPTSPGARVNPRTGEAPALVPPAAPEAVKKPRLSRAGKFIVALLIGLEATLLALYLAGPGTQQVATRGTGELPAVFSTSLLSLPPGALVQIDGQRAGKTPFKFKAERDRVYRVELLGGEAPVEVMVQNTRLLEVDLEQNAVIRDERYAGSRPRQKPKDKKAEPAPPPAPARTVALQATAPARFTLEREHQVWVDDGPRLPLVEGTLRELQAGYHSPGPAPTEQAQRELEGLSGPGKTPLEMVRGLPSQPLGGTSLLRHQCLLLTRTATGVDLGEMVDGTVDVPSLPSWAFVLTERVSGATETPPALAFQGSSQRLRASAAIIAVDRDDRFSVDGLAEKPAWKLTLTARDPARSAAVVVRLTPSRPDAPAMLDGVALERSTAVLAPGATYALSGASALWLTVPTVSSYEPGSIDVAIDPSAPSAQGAASEPSRSSNERENAGPK